ncbi:hypothetical protein ACFFX1_53800 [Dactylosporangium sucinum]|uniref:Uncharacterized protein n=1 Tax=Dactylosporangium sucinum TaxID=1424081 RepID=A0A917U7V8_9ACTN|nr:hypothetical protein [Dactylosporangium sucinum]GGM61527.1 hypothetical protein GCM10007977_073740 [Dactylosporangium sucinum]
MLVEEAFARFEDEAIGTFRPLPVAALPARRRRRWPWLAGLAAALTAVAVPLAVRPADAPPPPPQVVVHERTIRLPGVDGRSQWATFADATRGWATIGVPCPQVECPVEVARTSDAGLTWQRITLPRPDLYDIRPIDRDRVVFGNFTGETFMLSEDGGDTFRPVGPDDPAVQQSRPGGTPPEPRPAVAPPPSDFVQRITKGSAGTSWALTFEAQRRTNTVWWSDDDGVTWHALAGFDPIGGLVVSPDGRQAYFLESNTGRLWRLAATGHTPVALPPDVRAVHGALDDGRLLVSTADLRYGFWRDGTFTPIDARVNEHITDAWVLPDGTLVLGRKAPPVISPDGGVTWIRFG